MTEINSVENEVNEAIEVILIGYCQSISGRSTISFEIGRHKVDGTQYLRIAGNSGKGMWSKDWASASAIQEIVLSNGVLVAKSFHPLHAGRSINTGGFCLAALRELGLIRPNEANTRVHEYVPEATFEKVVSSYIAQAKPTKPETSGRKTLRLKTKED